jgi:hypothetical protein
VSPLNLHVPKRPHAGARKIVLYGGQHTARCEGGFDPNPGEADILEGKALRCHHSGEISQGVETLPLE